MLRPARIDLENPYIWRTPIYEDAAPPDAARNRVLRRPAGACKGATSRVFGRLPRHYCRSNFAAGRLTLCTADSENEAAQLSFRHDWPISRCGRRLSGRRESGIRYSTRVAAGSGGLRQAIRVE